MNKWVKRSDGLDLDYNLKAWINTSSISRIGLLIGHIDIKILIKCIGFLLLTDRI